MPGTLFAEIATPRPVPHTSSARSASPSRIFSAAAIATAGYGVRPSALTPTSMTSETRGSFSRSALRASLYWNPASSDPTAIRHVRPISMLLLLSEDRACSRDGQRERHGTRVRGAEALLHVRTRPPDPRSVSYTHLTL